MLGYAWSNSNRAQGWLVGCERDSVTLGGLRFSDLSLDIDRQIQGRFICAGGIGGTPEAGGAAARYLLL
jgi:hypothetical protein